MLIHVEAHLVGKDDVAVFTLVDDGFDLIAKLLEFCFGYLSLKDGVLNPAQVLPTELEHFAHALHVYIIDKDDIHYQYILKGLYSSIPRISFCNL